MSALRPAAALCHAAWLRRVVAQAHHDSNLALQQLSAERRHANRVPTLASFRYVTLADGDTAPVARAIPGALFQRQYGLCLDTLELSLYGYCVERRFGWERRVEPTFSTRPPPRWRRLLRRAPLLALTLRAGSGATEIGVSVARAGSAASRAALVVRLDAELGAELALAHQAATAVPPSAKSASEATSTTAPTLGARLLAWLRRRARA